MYYWLLRCFRILREFYETMEWENRGKGYRIKKNRGLVKISESESGSAPNRIRIWTHLDPLAS